MFYSPKMKKVLGKTLESDGYAVFDYVQEEKLGCLVFNVFRNTLDVWFPGKKKSVPFPPCLDYAFPAGTKLPKESWPCLEIIAEAERKDSHRMHRLYATLQKEIGFDPVCAFKFAQTEKLPHLEVLTACNLDVRGVDLGATKPELSILFKSDDIFYRTVGTMSKEDLLQKVKETYHLAFNFQDMYNKSLVCDRLLEQGVTVDDFSKAFGPHIELSVGKSIDLQRRKYAVMSAMLETNLPNDVVKIIYAYIPWFDYVKLPYYESLLLEQLTRIINLERVLMNSSTICLPS